MCVQIFVLYLCKHLPNWTLLSMLKPYLDSVEVTSEVASSSNISGKHALKAVNTIRTACIINQSGNLALGQECKGGVK